MTISLKIACHAEQERLCEPRNTTKRLCEQYDIPIYAYFIDRLTS